MTATATRTRNAAATTTFGEKTADRWQRPVTPLVDKATGALRARIVTLPAGTEEKTGGRYMVELFGVTGAARYSYAATALEARNAAKQAVKALDAARAAAADADALAAADTETAGVVDDAPTLN